MVTARQNEIPLERKPMWTKSRQNENPVRTNAHQNERWNNIVFRDINNNSWLLQQQNIIVISDTSPAKLTVCERFVMNDWIQSMTDPRIPNADCRRSSRIWWSTVSKAADRSSNANSVTCPRSQARSRSETIFRTAVSVECCCRYADWWLGRRECLWRNATSWRQTSLSTVFDMNVRFEIGL